MENFSSKVIFFLKNSLKKLLQWLKQYKYLFFNYLIKNLTRIMFILRSNANESEGGDWTIPDSKEGFHTRVDQPAIPSLDFCWLPPFAVSSPPN